MTNQHAHRELCAPHQHVERSWRIPSAARLVLANHTRANLPLEKTARIVRKVLTLMRAQRDFGTVVLCVRVVDDPALRRYNRIFHHDDRPTDVLAFPYPGEPNEPAGSIEGDILISLRRVRENAPRWGQTWWDEFVYVLIHGVLHIFGERDTTPPARAHMLARQDALFAAVRRMR